MNTKTITIILLVVIVIIAVITNPKKQLHAEEVSLKIYPNVNVMFKVGSATLTAQIINYDNYIVFSIGKYDNIKSLGLFGNVFILTSDKEISKLNKQSDKNISKKPKKKMVDPETQKKLDKLIGG